VSDVHLSRLALFRVAAKLAGPAASSLFLFTDPRRLLDPVAAAGRLPRGSAVVFRAFGRPDALTVGRRLRAVCDRGGLRLLVGADEALAAAVGADGLHLPERAMGELRRLRGRRPSWLLTTAAHSARAARRAAGLGADGVFVSTVFASASPSAGRPIGALRLAVIARGTRAPVFALGGVDRRTAGRLLGTGVAGFAAVEALA
jgi:thiamine-phosphate pyrophosphorylase